MTTGVNLAREDWAIGFRNNMESCPTLAGLHNIDYLELGVFEGRSAVFMLTERLLGGGSYTGVDGWDLCSNVMADREVYRAALDNIKRVARVPFWLRRGLTTDELPKLLQAEKRFDLVYVDAGHSYGEALHDSLFAWRLTKPGGIVLWDDMPWNCPYDPAQPLGPTGFAVRDFMGGLGFKLTDGLFLNWQFAIQKPLDCVTY